MSQISQRLKMLLFSTPVHTVMTIVAACIVAASGIGLYLATSGPDTYDFSMNQKVSQSSVLRLAFPDTMNKSSVEEHLDVPENLKVTKEWEDNVLVLKPTEKLEMNTTYVIRLAADTLRADGSILGRELAYSFTVTGAPVVALHLPETDSVNVPPNSEISLIFDRPVVPLTQVQGPDAASRFKDWPVKISPEVSGRWRWLGTTTATFVPTKGLKLATKYTVTVPAGIATISGDKTEQDFTWSFETERPVVTATDPSPDTASAGPTTLIDIGFNHDMDLVTAKDFIRLSERKNTDASAVKTSTGSTSLDLAIKQVRYGVIEDEDGKKTTDKTHLVAIPEKPLQFQKTYDVSVLAGIRGLEGNLGSASGHTFSFRTVGAFKASNLLYGVGLTMEFTNPVSAEELKKNIVITPAVEDLKPEDFTVYEQWGTNNQTYWSVLVYPKVKPSTSYKVTLKGTLTDIYGQKVEKGLEYSFKTDPLPSEVFVHPRWSGFSIFEKAKPPVYFLNAMNIKTMQAELGHLTFEKFLEKKQMNLYNGQIGNMDMKTETEDYKTWTVAPKLKQDTWDSIPFDLQEKAGKLKPGVYVFKLTSPEWKSYDNLTPQYDIRALAVTNIGLTLKFSHGKALVWAIDLQTGDPVKGAVIKFRTLLGGTPVTGKTDKNGFFETMLNLAEYKNGGGYDYVPEFYVTAETADDFAFIGSTWNNGVGPYDFGYSGDFRSADAAKYRVQSFVYTDRPIYRTGDSVQFKGIIRLLNQDGVLQLPETSRSVSVRINDSNGTEVYNKSMKLSAFGTFNDSFKIAGEAPLGYYGISVTVTPDSDIEGGAWGSFSVLAYRKPEYKVQVTSDKDEYRNGETAKVTIDGQYYFGAPMGQADVRWRTVSTDYFFNKYTEGWYSFALEDSWCWYDCVRGNSIVTENSGKLDAAGRLTVTVPTNIDDKAVSQVMSVEADITDRNNQVVSARQSFVVHKSGVYVGITSDDYGVSAGQNAKMKVITLKPDGSPVPNASVELKLYSRKWNTIKEKGVDGEYYYDNKAEDTFIRSVKVRTDEKGKAIADVRIDDGGEFRVVASTVDDSGLESKAGFTVYAWADMYYNWPRTNSDRMDIVADKPMYKVGDVAKLVVKSPFQGAGVKALVTVERENVISKNVVDVTSNALPIEVPITEDLVPTAYVSVVVIKPRIGETFNENGLDTGAPAFKVGYVKLPIDTAPKKITVTIETDKQKYVPAETVVTTITAKDSEGKPIQGEFSLGVVDLSLLDLTGFSLPDVVSSFYYERSLGVMTSNMLTFLMERFKPGSKGGGGDGEGRTRGNFLDTAYWNPKILTDKDGKAQVSFKLPDNLTTWQLLAIGSTKDHKFGSYAMNIIETKKVILRPVRPRFVVAGDKVTLGAIVHNYLDEDRTFDVTLEGKNMQITGSPKQTINVQKNAQVKVSFPVIAGANPEMMMHFSAVTDGAKDDIQETIPVFAYGVQQTNATNGVTEDQVTETVQVPAKNDASDGELTVSVAPSLAVFMQGGLEYLANFPYGCAEQVTSSFVPNVALMQLQGFEQFSFVDKKTLEKNVQAGLQKLYKFQREDGGFGYWEGSDYSYPYLSAYILYALKITQNANHYVDQSVIMRGTQYLQSEAGKKDDKHLSDEERVYIQYVLAEHGKADVAALNALLKNRANLPIFSRAELAMAYQLAGTSQAKSRAKDLLTEILNLARVDARGAKFDESGVRYPYAMNTADRTTAMVLQAVTRIEPTNVLIPKIISGVLSSRRNGHWDTTQSTSQTILALVEYLKASKELEYDYKSTVQVAGKNVMDASFKAPALERKSVEVALTQLARGKPADVKIGKSGPGKMYYDISMSYFATPDIIQPAEEGIGILQEIEPLTKNDAMLKVGSTQRVTITVTVPETRNFVAVESMLPAGFEAIDLGFVTSQQNLLGNAANAITKWSDYYENQLWRFSHIEFRDDRVFLFADELPPGVYRYQYLVRATTPGKFHYRPARVWEMYFPETFGQTDGKWIDIAE